MEAAFAGQSVEPFPVGGQTVREGNADTEDDEVVVGHPCNHKGGKTAADIPLGEELVAFLGGSHTVGEHEPASRTPT